MNSMGSRGVSDNTVQQHIIKGIVKFRKMQNNNESRVQKEEQVSSSESNKERLDMLHAALHNKTQDVLVLECFCIAHFSVTYVLLSLFEEKRVT